MDQLIYESTGGSKKAQQIAFICCIVLVAFGIFFCMLSQLKTSTFFGIETYVLPLGLRIEMVTIGCILAIYGIAMYILGQRAREMSYFRIFETHVEGCMHNGFTKKVFNASFQEIEDVVRTSKFFGLCSITIWTKHMKYVYMLDQSEADEALRSLEKCVSTILAEP